MAKIDPKSLTLDSRRLLSLSIQDRISFFKTPEGKSYLASLSPIEYNRLLSSYHQKQLAPLTGGSIGSVSGGAQTATPASSGRPSATPSGPSATPTPSGPQQPRRQQVRPAGPTVGPDTRFAWEKRLEELANQARGQQQGQQQQGQPQQQREISTSGLSTPELTRRVILETARNRGWSKEGTAALLGMTRQESNFNPYVIGDGGRSHGIFQVANNFGSRGKESRLDRFVSIAKRKTGLDDPLKYIRDVKSGKIKPDPTITRGLIESSIEHFVDNDVDSKINNQNVQRALKSTNPVEATEYLLRATRPKNWNEQGKSGWQWSKRLRNTQNELPGVTKDLEQQIKEGLSPGVSPEEAAKTGKSDYDGPRKSESGKTRQEQKEKFVDRTEEMNAVNYGSKSSKKEPYKFIGVHYTGGESLSSAINVAKNKNEGYQFLIDKDGTVHMVQDPDKGRSNHWGKNNIHREAKNSNSIGISFVGSSNKTITKEQIQAGLRLIEQQRQKYGIDPRNVLGHGETTRNHRADTEGYGLLEPFRQRHGLTPQTGNTPNIASDGGIRAWKSGKYNYDLETLQEREEKTKEIKPPDGYENLPEDIRKAIDELPESRRNKAYDNLRAFSEKHSNWIETYTQAHREAIDQGANSQEAAKNIAETASVSPNSAASVAPPPLPGTTQEVQGETVFEQQRQLGATRKLAINPNLKDKIEEAVLSVYGPGYKAEVYSGGQPEIGTSSQRKGGTRHDTGKAADIRIRTPDGKILAREQQVPLVQYWASKGYGGIGIGMGGGGLHLDIHKTGGNNAWGYRGSTNSWNFLSKAEQKALIEAKKEGFVAPISRQEFTDYSKRVAERTNVLRQQGLNATQARQQARVEVREQINQTIREKEAAAATQTAPVVPTQTQQPVSPGVNPADAARTGGSGYNQTPTPSGQIPGQVLPAASTTSKLTVERKIADIVVERNGVPVQLTPEEQKKVDAVNKFFGNKNLNAGPVQQTAPAAPAAPAAETVPSEPTAEPVKTEKPPEYEYGGEQQLNGENLSVVNRDTGEVELKFNSSETGVFKNGRMEVIPASRDNSVGIEDRTNQILQQEQVVADQQTDQMEMTQRNSQITQTFDSGYNKDWDAMMADLKSSSGGIYKNPTAARAYDGHRFAASGDVFKHFGFKTPTLKMV